MAFVDMQKANPGDLARSAEYNNVVNNVLDLDSRVTAEASTNAAQAAAISTLETRTTDTRTGNSALGNRLSTLESAKLPGAFYGQWIDNNALNEGQLIDTNPGEKVTEFVNPIGTATGMTMSGGSVTVANSGLYAVTASLQFAANSGTVVAMWISKSNAASGSGLTKFGPTSGYRSDILSSAAILRMNAGESVSVYCAVWQNTPAIKIYRANSNILTVAYLGA